MEEGDGGGPEAVFLGHVARDELEDVVIDGGDSLKVLPARLLSHASPYDPCQAIGCVDGQNRHRLRRLRRNLSATI